MKVIKILSVVGVVVTFFGANAHALQADLETGQAVQQVLRPATTLRTAPVDSSSIGFIEAGACCCAGGTAMVCTAVFAAAAWAPTVLAVISEQNPEDVGLRIASVVVNSVYLLNACRESNSSSSDKNEDKTASGMVACGQLLCGLAGLVNVPGAAVALAHGHNHEAFVVNIVGSALYGSFFSLSLLGGVCTALNK